MLTENDIERIIARIVAGYGGIAAGSFGSYAIGRAGEGSDLDLFVIHNTPLGSSERRRGVMRHLHGVLHPLDVHVFTPEEFEVGAHEELSFAWIIVRQARIYYWTDSAQRLVPSLSARR